MPYDDTDLETVDDLGYDEPPASALDAVLASARTTTPEAKRYAQQILDAGLAAKDTTTPVVITGMEDSAEATRKALQEARARLVAHRMNPGGRWLSMAAGFGKPANTIGQTMGNVASSMLDYNATTDKNVAGRNKDLLGLDTAEIGAGAPVLDAKMKMEQLRQKNQAALMAQALRTMGTSTASTTTVPKSLSAYGKQAQDEGLTPGTPQFANRVRQLYGTATKQRNASAGIDVEELDTQERVRIAADYGVPVAPDLGAGLSTKERAARRSIESRQAQKKLDALATDAEAAQTDITDADRFMVLNEEERSGPAVGMLPGLSDAAQEMDSISSRLSRQMRNKGEGQTSDYDAKQFLKATFSRTKNYDANDNIATAFKVKKQLVLDKQSYMDDYFAVNPNGTASHAESMWRRYLNDNTIFDKASQGKLKLNPDRKSYKEYFSGAVPVEHKAAGGKVGSAVKALKSLSNTVQGAEPDVEEMVRGTKHMEGVPTSTRERLNALYYQMKEAQATGQDPSVAREALLNHLGELYLTNSPSLKLTSPELAPQPPQIDMRSRPRTLEEIARSVDAFGVQKKAGGGKVSEPSIPEGMLLSALQGGTMGLSDEMLGAGDAESLARQRELLRRFMQKYPMLSGASATAGTLPLAMVPGGSGLTGMAARGAGFGAASGVGGGEGPEDRLYAAMQSGALGTGAGVLGGLAAKYGTSGALSMADHARGMPTLTSADRRMVGALQRDKTDPATVLGALRSAQRQKVPSTVFDEAGPNTRALANAAIAKGTPQGEQLSTDLAQRQMGARGRVNERINQSLKPNEYFDELDKLKGDLYTNAKPLYDAAYKNAPPVPFNTVGPILDNDFGRKALKDAVKLMKADQVPVSKGAVMGAGKKAGVSSLNLQTLDYTKRALDDMINAEEATGSTNKGRILRKMRNNLVAQLDAVSPDYVQARQQYAGDLEMVDALKSGREEFSQMTPEEVRRKVAKMGFSERDAYRSGVAQNLYSMLNSPSTDINAARRLVGSPDITDKLQAVFDKPAEFKVFKAALDREMQNFEHTKPLLTEAARARKTTAAGGTSILETMDPHLREAPGVGALSWLTRSLNILRHQWPMTDETADKVATVLSKGDPKDASAALSKLEDAAVRLSKRKKLSGKAAMVGAAAAGALARPTPLPHPDALPEEQEEADAVP